MASMAPPAVSRHHLDVAGRRVHYRRAGSGPPVLLLHESPRSSVALLPLMAQAPAGLTLLAPDTPGNGLSQPLAGSAPSADDYADALAQTLTALGIERTVVYGRHSGAAFGSAFALRHPQRVARLVLDGVSAFNAAERAQLLDSYLPRFEPRVDGTHMAWLWSRLRDQALFFPWNHRGVSARLWLPMPAPQALHLSAMDFLMSGDEYRPPYRAAFAFDPAAVLPWLMMPADVAAREGDMLRPHLARLPALPPHVRVHALGDDRALADAQVWSWLAEGAQGLAAAPPAIDAALPADRLGDTLVGREGRRWHLRGATAGAGRPLVWLHPSPGGARARDRGLEAHLGQRPLLAVDLPNHGESDAWQAEPEALLAELAALINGLCLHDAELRGEGLGAAVAAALAPHLPRAAAPEASPAAPGDPPERCPPRADGGHLLAAWLHAHDEAVLGSWWTRAAQPRFRCADALDVAAVHAHAVEMLKEGEGAAAIRSSWLGRSVAR